MQNVVKDRALISALADGQLAGEDFARTVEWVTTDETAQQTWHTYHVVGDVLRGGAVMAEQRDTAFLERLQISLKQEAPRLLTQDASDLIASNAITARSRGLKHINLTSANESHFRWKLLAGFASLAVVSVIGWQALQGSDAQGGARQLAQAPLQAPQADSAQAPVVTGEVEKDAAAHMIRDPRLDSLLAAHRQLAGTSALQMPAGFLRNATFEGAAR